MEPFYVGFIRHRKDCLLQTQVNYSDNKKRNNSSFITNLNSLNINRRSFIDCILKSENKYLFVSVCSRIFFGKGISRILYWFTFKTKKAPLK